MLPCLFQGYLDHREASEEIMSNVNTSEGVHLNHIKHCTKRKLTTRFGDVTVKRKSYSQRLHIPKLPQNAGVSWD